MKIIKSQLIENNLKEENDDNLTLSDINPSEDSISEIADGIKGSIEEISNGEKSISDDVAHAAAQEISQDAKELNAGAVAFNDSVADTEEESLEVENVLTHKLDKALREVRKGARQKNYKNANVLVTGLPGSGKTSIVFDWAAKKGNNVNVFDVSASDPDLEAAVYGLTLRDITSDTNKTTKAPSDFLDKLDRPNSVLFLDEFNRANSKLRRALLQLVNEHAVADARYPKGVRPFNNLLFTVACVNPGGLRTDRNAEPLNDAEKSRFAIKTPFDSNVEASIDYFTKHWNKLIKKLDPADSYYDEDLSEYLYTQDLGLFIVSHPDFAYDTKADLDDLFDENRTMLNQRELTDGLNLSDGNINEFKAWIEEDSEFLDRDKQMLFEILDDYTQPSLNSLIKAKINSGVLAGNAEDFEEPEEKSDDSDEGIEDDVELFVNTTNNNQMSSDSIEDIINRNMASWV